MIPLAKELLRRLNEIKVFRYLVSGGTAAFTDLALLYVMTDFLHIWYVVSVTAAFLVAFVVSFTAQKFWTFQDHSTDRIHAQGSMYFIAAVLTLVVNTYAVYLLVSDLHMFYMLAQILVSVLIAISNFFIYNKLIFRRTVPTTLT